MEDKLMRNYPHVPITRSQPQVMYMYNEVLKHLKTSELVGDNCYTAYLKTGVLNKQF